MSAPLRQVGRAGLALPGRTAVMLRNPLLVSSAASSATGALATILAAHLLPASEFSLFATLTLISLIVQALGRAALFEPALVHLRTTKSSVVPGRYAIILILVLAPIYGGTAALAAHTSLLESVLLAAASTLPVVQDWIRYRLLSEGKRWQAALGDVIRFVQLPTLFISAIPANAFSFQGRMLLWSVAACVITALFVTSITEWAPIREYWALIRGQVGDYAINAVGSNIPLLVLGSMLIGSNTYNGIRLAQTLLGPLNLLFSAFTMTLLADGATRPDLADRLTLVDAGKRTAWRLAGLSMAVVAAIGALTTVLPPSVFSVERNALLLGVALVGFNLAFSGWTGVHITTLRLLREVGRIVVARVVLVAAVLVAYFVPLVFGFAEASLVTGYLANAVLFPVTFGLLAFSTYRRYARS